jgi:hypothetical protein
MSGVGSADPFQVRHEVGPLIQSNDGRIGGASYRRLSLRRATVRSPRRPLVRRLLLLRRLPQGLGFGVYPVHGLSEHYGALQWRVPAVRIESGIRERRGAQFLSGLRRPGFWWRSRQERLLHHLCRLSRRSLFLSSYRRHLHTRPAGLRLIPPELRAFEALPV